MKAILSNLTNSPIAYVDLITGNTYDRHLTGYVGVHQAAYNMADAHHRAGISVEDGTSSEEFSALLNRYRIEMAGVYSEEHFEKNLKRQYKLGRRRAAKKY